MISMPKWQAPFAAALALFMVPLVGAAHAPHSQANLPHQPEPPLPAVHIDRQAGIKFEIPFANPRTLSGSALQDLLRRQAGGQIPEGVVYTSAVYAEGQVPYVLIWTRKAEGAASRDLVDLLTAGASDRAEATAGLTPFSFTKDLLRGEGSLADQGGLKVKILLQLVKDRYTYVGFYYREPSQLAAFEHIKRTLKVGRLSRLSYESLPPSSTNELTLSDRLTALSCAFLGGGLAAGGIALVLRARRRQRQPWDHHLVPSRIPEVGTRMGSTADGHSPVVDFTPAELAPESGVAPLVADGPTAARP